MDRARDNILDEIITIDKSKETKKQVDIIKSYSGEELYKLHKLKDSKMKEIEFFLINCYTAKYILENIEDEKFAPLKEKLMDSNFYLMGIDYLRNMAVIANYFTYLSIDSLSHQHYLAVKKLRDLAHSIEELFKNLKLSENEDEIVVSSINENQEKILLSQKEYEKLYNEYLVQMYAASLNNDLDSYLEIFWIFMQRAVDKEINNVFNNLDKFLAIAYILLNSKIDKTVPILMIKLLASLKGSLEKANSLFDTIYSDQMPSNLDVLESILGR